MQIGTAGSAYGPSVVMSRPTVGNAISPIPGGTQNVLQAALARARRMPLRSGGTSQNANMQELQRRQAATQQALLAHQKLAAGAVRQALPLTIPTALIGIPDPSTSQTAVTDPSITQTASTTGLSTDIDPSSAFTIDPSTLLARARLQALLGGGS